MSLVQPNPEPIQRRAFKNTAVGGVSLLVSIGLGLLSVPICLRTWGADRYGAWLALFAGFSLLRTIDGGYGNYVGTQLNILYHGDRVELRRSLAAALPICFFLSLFQLIVCGVLAATGRTGWFLGASQADVARYDLTTALVVLVCSGMLAANYLSIIPRLLIPLGLMYQASWWAIVYQVGIIGTLIGSALCGVSILRATIIYGVLQGAIYVGSALYVRAKAMDLFPWWRSPELRVGARDFMRSLLLTANGVGQQAISSGVVIFVSSMFGTASVPVFTTTRTLSNLWVSVANVFGTPLLPEIVRFHVMRDHAKLLKAFQAHWFFGGTIVNASMILALPFIKEVYRRWTHGALHFEQGLLVTGMVSVSLVNFGLVLNIYLVGINNLKAQLVTTIVRATLMLAISFVLVPSLALTGVGLAMVVAELVCSVGLGIYFTNLTLADFDASLPLPEVSRAFLIGLPFHLLALETVVDRRIHLGSCALAAVALAALTWWNWRTLDADVRTRVMQVLARR